VNSALDTGVLTNFLIGLFLVTGFSGSEISAVVLFDFIQVLVVAKQEILKMLQMQILQWGCTPVAIGRICVLLCRLVFHLDEGFLFSVPINTF
jgi:hypothetical protein